MDRRFGLAPTNKQPVEAQDIQAFVDAICIVRGTTGVAARCQHLYAYGFTIWRARMVALAAEDAGAVAHMGREFHPLWPPSQSVCDAISAFEAAQRAVVEIVTRFDVDRSAHVA